MSRECLVCKECLEAMAAAHDKSRGFRPRGPQNKKMHRITPKAPEYFKDRLGINFIQLNFELRT